MADSGSEAAASPPSVDAALDAVNGDFHDAYDEARVQEEKTAPVFVVLADVLVVVRGEEREERPFTPALFHVIKSVAHAPVAVFAALARVRANVRGEPTRRRLAAIGENVAASTRSLDGPNDFGAPEALAAARGDLHEVLQETAAYLLRVEAEGLVVAALEAFARAMGPRLLRLTEHATRLQLDALDACVERALATLDVTDRRRLRVVVTGDHQARVRSLGMQYFNERLAKSEEGPPRVTYGESVTDIEGALALIGRQQLDVVIARAFFGDPSRLQRDVLGDAVHEELGRRRLTRID